MHVGTFLLRINIFSNFKSTDDIYACRPIIKLMIFEVRMTQLALNRYCIFYIQTAINVYDCAIQRKR